MDNTLAVFVTQFTLSLILVALFANWYVAPWLSDKSAANSLSILILPHTFRHVGLTFLVPGVAAETMPSGFAAAAGYGDLASGLLALLALVALHQRWNMAIALVWIFNIVGTADLLNALRQAEAVPHFGATWFIPTFLVPVLLVTHFLIFARLVKRPLIEPNKDQAIRGQYSG